MEISTEKLVANINKNHFLKEFTYSNQRFKTENGEDEFSDSAIWIDDLLILQEIKERDAEKQFVHPDEQLKWFENKVCNKATNQLVKTRQHLDEGKSILLQNERGVTVDLAFCNPSSVIQLIVFKAPQTLLMECVVKKANISKRIGFVHIFNSYDYYHMCNTLFTPIEIADYLRWREDTYRCFPEDFDMLLEKALVGQYVSGKHTEKPSIIFEKFVDNLGDCMTYDNLYGILTNFKKCLVPDSDPKQYYFILKEFAKFPRDCMRPYYKMFMEAKERCRIQELTTPSRMALPQYDCSYIIIPVNSMAERGKELQYYTYLSKYMFRTTKAIGVMIAPTPQSEEHILANWCYLDEPWESNSKTDNFLKKNGSPFHPVKGIRLNKYEFK